MSKPVFGWWHRILYWFSGNLPCKIINGPQGEPYLERYMLFRLGGWAVFLHRFLASDSDRGVHDHPWDLSISLILQNGYQEIRKAGDSIIMRRKHPFTFNVIRGTDFHRVVLDGGHPAWTIFSHGTRTKNWGFLPYGLVNAKSLSDTGELHDAQFRSFEPFIDPTKTEEAWEKTAPLGKRHERRKSVDFYLPA